MTSHLANFKVFPLETCDLLVGVHVPGGVAHAVTTEYDHVEEYYDEGEKFDGSLDDLVEFLLDNCVKDDRRVLWALLQAADSGIAGFESEVLEHAQHHAITYCIFGGDTNHSTFDPAAVCTDDLERYIRLIGYLGGPADEFRALNAALNCITGDEGFGHEQITDVVAACDGLLDPSDIEVIEEELLGMLETGQGNAKPEADAA